MNVDMLFENMPTFEIRDYLLRRIEISDVDDLFELHNDPSSVEYQTDFPMKSIEEVESLIKMVHWGYDNRYFIRWGIEDVRANKLIGIFSMHHIDIRNASTQFGYIMNASYRNKGITSLILNEMSTRFLSPELFNRIELTIHPDNIASIRTAEKAGFEKEGISRKCVFNARTKTYDDRLIMSRLR